MRRVQRRNNGRRSPHFGDQEVQCLPDAVMRSRAVRLAFAQGFALANWPVPVGFIRLIAMLLLGVASAQAVAVDSGRSDEVRSMSSVHSHGIRFAEPANRLVGHHTSANSTCTRPKTRGVPSHIATDIVGPPIGQIHSRCRFSPEANH